MARAYIDYVLLIPEHEFLDHLKSWGVFLQKLAESGLKVNVEKYFFGRAENEYLVFWVSNQGVRPIMSKVDAINKIEVPTKVYGVRRYVGLVNYHRDL